MLFALEGAQVLHFPGYLSIQMEGYPAQKLTEGSLISVTLLGGHQRISSDYPFLQK